MKILKIIIPLSCAILLCSCGTTAAQKEESSDSKKVDVVNESADSATKIYLKDYTSLEFKGYDTVGSSGKFKFDIEKLVKDNAAAFNGDDKTIISDILTSFDTVDVLPDKHLSNGDTVKMSIDGRIKEINDKYNIELITDNLEFTVTGLNELEEIDPFSKAEYSFENDTTDPSGQNKVFCFSVPSYSTLLKVQKDKECAKIGETITVEFITLYGDGTTVEQTFAKEGYKPTRIKAEYIVE